MEFTLTVNNCFSTLVPTITDTLRDASLKYFFYYYFQRKKKASENIEYLSPEMNLTDVNLVCSLPLGMKHS